MGGGSWTSRSFASYSTAKGMSLDSSGSISGSYSAQDMFKAATLDPALNPYQVMRECCDSEEHPNTIPVIIGLDVTGSMGQTAVEVAKKLGVIMTKLYEQVEDIEFLIMGIGDLAYDQFPIQASQFESDIRIAEQLDKIFFEFGGGGNAYESYTSAWYFGARHTKLDCWKRGKKGIIITIGDEQLNPYLPLHGRISGLVPALGDNLQANVETKDIIEEVSEKFDVYHIDVAHRYRYDTEQIHKTFKDMLPQGHYKSVKLNEVADVITEMILMSAKDDGEVTSNVNKNAISW